MKRHLKSLSTQTLVYGGGLVLKRGIGFFMIPVYTRFLSPSDYGRLEILDLTGFIAAFFIGFGILQAVFRFHPTAAGPDEQRRVQTNAVLTVSLLGGAVALVLLLASPLLARIVLGDPGATALVALVIAGVFFGEIGQLLLGFFRVDANALGYTAFSVASTLLGLTLNIVLLVGFGLGVTGILLSSLISSSLLAAVLLARKFRGGGWKIDPQLVRSMLLYCLPFIPQGLMAFTVNFSDRFFLKAFGAMADVGVYALGYKLGMIVGFLIGTPFTLVWSAQAFEIAKTEEGRPTFARVLTYYMIALVAVAATLGVLAPELVEVLATAEYAGAAKVVPIVAWCTLLFAANMVLQVGMLVTKRTSLLPLIWSGTTFINVSLNIVLIPRIGMMGAAWSTLAAAIFQAAASLVISQRLYPIPFEWRRLAIIIAAGLGAQGLASGIPDLPIAEAVAVKLLVLVACGAALLLLPGFLRTGERAAIASLARRAVGSVTGADR